MRIYAQFAAVTQLRTGLLLEVVFGVRAIIAGCDAAVGSVTTVLPTTIYFIQFSAVGDWSVLLRVVSALGRRRSVYNYTLITVIPRQRECHIQRYGSFAKQTTESL